MTYQGYLLFFHYFPINLYNPLPLREHWNVGFGPCLFKQTTCNPRCNGKQLLEFPSLLLQPPKEQVIYPKPSNIVVLLKNSSTYLATFIDKPGL